MPVSLEQFARHLEECGLVSGAVLRDLFSGPDAPRDIEGLANELVRLRTLTAFQADEARRGRAQSLVLGNYLLLDRIGQGGMGQVYKARHRRMDRIVAVKVLPPNVSDDDAAVARFEREVKAVALLSHPNIVSAFDADFANGVHFLVMEYVDGADLASVLRKEGPLPVGNAVDYIKQAARGLAAAHAGGIIHRDIKPANLLLDRRGVVKVLDMGLARIEAATDTALAELTGTGTVMGTIDYMAPEQALSTRSADARADIYSLGCTLFTLLTARPTYDGETMTARLIAHQNMPSPSLRAVRPEVPEALDVLFGRMVQKRADDRVQTMAEVVEELERIETSRADDATPIAALFADDSVAFEIAGETVIAEPTDRTYPTERGPVRKGADVRSRKRGFGLAMGLCGVVVGAVAGVFAFQNGRPPGTDVRTRPEPGTSVTETPPSTSVPRPSPAVVAEVAPRALPVGDGPEEGVRRPPEGFIALFNGEDLQGWQGAVPWKEMLALAEDERVGRQQDANEAVLPHWTVKDGVLHADGEGSSLETIAHYRDFELQLDWKSETATSGGIDLRGASRVPAEKGVRPAGEWNRFRILVRGDRVTVFLNGGQVVDSEVLENSRDRGQPVPASGPIELQHDGGRVEFRNIFLKVLAAE